MSPAGIHVVADGPAAGTGVLLVQPTGGLHSRVFLDRGMDLGRTWFAGYPVSWTSAIGEQCPGHADRDEGWHRGWAGGLMTTCGLRHIGMPRDGHGRHRTCSDSAATDVAVRRHRHGGSPVVDVARDGEALGRTLVLPPDPFRGRQPGPPGRYRATAARRVSSSVHSWAGRSSPKVVNHSSI